MDGQDIIVVSLNYRLGALGFLNTGDNVVRGNMGLKDQNMALRFVRDNIAKFGGDPGNVTLFGQGSGGACVHYHVISPLSKGLFQRAIMQTGNLFCPWAFTRSPKKQAFRFGAMVDCSNQTTAALVSCLRSKNGTLLVSKHAVLLSPVHKQDDVFAGSVEMGDRKWNDTFLAENPFTMLSRGDFSRVPVIFGENSGDGALKTARLEAYPDILKSLHTREGWNENVPILLHYNPELTNVSTQLLNYYFSDPPTDLRTSSNNTITAIESCDDGCTSGEVLRNITRMISDGVWFYATELAARNHSKFAPTYLSYFTYASKTTWLPSAYNCLQYANVSTKSPERFWVACYLREVYHESLYDNIHGACHSDDMTYYWRMGVSPRITEYFPSTTIYEFSRDFIATLSSFVKRGEPLSFRGVKWEQVKGNYSEPLQYMKLGRNHKMIYHPYQDGINFIKSLNIWDPYNLNNY